MYFTFVAKQSRYSHDHVADHTLSHVTTVSHRCSRDTVAIQMLRTHSVVAKIARGTQSRQYAPKQSRVWRLSRFEN